MATAAQMDAHYQRTSIPRNHKLPKPRPIKTLPKLLFLSDPLRQNRYPNPDFAKAIETYGADFLPADHPNQYIGYLYNSQTEEMLPFSPADLGYEENMHMVLVPREEIVPLDDIGNEK